ncbi:MAG: polyphosphate kinase [Sphingomonas sp.]|nr:polyphosphate kinase [Sphingomonas sp.]
MPIKLTEFERGAPFDGDADAALGALQSRIARLQLGQIVHRQRAIILFEGWTGSNKKDALKKLVAALDPTRAHVVHVAPGDEADDDRHWLAPLWSHLPSAGEIIIIYRSWYRRMVEQRVLGRLDDKRWARVCDEINEFEAQQRDHGTMFVKLFFHVTAERQAANLQSWMEDPWLRHLKELQPLVGMGQRDHAVEVLEDFFRQTDTRWAPWRIIDDNDPVAGSIAALAAIADQFEKMVPAEPPSVGETIVHFRSQRPEQNRA